MPVGSELELCDEVALDDSSICATTSNAPRQNWMINRIFVSFNARDDTFHMLTPVKIENAARPTSMTEYTDGSENVLTKTIAGEITVITTQNQPSHPPTPTRPGY
jgi:hypothetical protein